jgi:hypothetical protein
VLTSDQVFKLPRRAYNTIINLLAVHRFLAYPPGMAIVTDSKSQDESNESSLLKNCPSQVEDSARFVCLELFCQSSKCRAMGCSVYGNWSTDLASGFFPASLRQAFILGSLIVAVITFRRSRPQKLKSGFLRLLPTRLSHGEATLSSEP